MLVTVRPLAFELPLMAAPVMVTFALPAIVRVCGVAETELIWSPEATSVFAEPVPELLTVRVSPLVPV